MKWKSYLTEGQFDSHLFTYKNVSVTLNLKDSKSSSHIEDRLKERANLTLSQFKEKVKKIIDSIPNALTGTYLAVLKNSMIKIPFKYTRIKGKPDDMYILTVLDIAMVGKDFDKKIELDEYFFNLYGMMLKDNEYKVIEEGFHSFIEFSVENNEQKVEGIELLEIEA